MSGVFYLGAVVGVIVAAVIMTCVMFYWVKYDRYHELTFPDCPSCGNWLDGDCRFKCECIVMTDADGCRVGVPSKYKD